MAPKPKKTALVPDRLDRRVTACFSTAQCCLPPSTESDTAMPASLLRHTHTNVACQPQGTRLLPPGWDHKGSCAGAGILRVVGGRCQAPSDKARESGSIDGAAGDSEWKVWFFPDCAGRRVVVQVAVSAARGRPGNAPKDGVTPRTSPILVQLAPDATAATTAVSRSRWADHAASAARRVSASASARQDWVRSIERRHTRTRRRLSTCADGRRFRRGFRTVQVTAAAIVGFWRRRYDGSPLTTSSYAADWSRSIADCANSGSAIIASHSTGSRFDVVIVAVRRCLSTMIS